MVEGALLMLVRLGVPTRKHNIELRPYLLYERNPLRVAAVRAVAVTETSEDATVALLPVVWDPEITVRSEVLERIGEVGLDHELLWALQVWRVQADWAVEDPNRGTLAWSIEPVEDVLAEAVEKSVSRGNSLVQPQPTEGASMRKVKGWWREES